MFTYFFLTRLKNNSDYMSKTCRTLQSHGTSVYFAHYDKEENVGLKLKTNAN